MAGLRLGYLAADPSVVDALQLVRLALSPVDADAGSRAGRARLSGSAAGNSAGGVVQRDRIGGCAARARPEGGLQRRELHLVGTFPDAQQTWQALLDKGVLVRDPAIPGHLRIAAGTPAETDALIAALQSIGGAPTWPRSPMGRIRTHEPDCTRRALRRLRPNSSSTSTSTAPDRATSSPESGSTTTCSPRWPNTAGWTSPFMPRVTCTSMLTTRSKTWRSRWARPSPKHWGTRSASRVMATLWCRWTRFSFRLRWTCPAGPTSCTRSRTT